MKRTVWSLQGYTSEKVLVVVCKCLSQGFYSCTNIMTKKQVGEERVYSAYTSTLLVITKVRTGSQAGQEAGADAEAMEGCYLLTCFPWLAQLVLLQNPRLPAQGWHHSQGAFPPWSLIEKMPYSWISWRHFLNWSSFLCDNSSLSQVDTQNQSVQLYDHSCLQVWNISC